MISYASDALWIANIKTLRYVFCDDCLDKPLYVCSATARIPKHHQFRESPVSSINTWFISTNIENISNNCAILTKIALRNALFWQYSVVETVLFWRKIFGVYTICDLPWEWQTWKSRSKPLFCAKIFRKGGFEGWFGDFLEGDHHEGTVLYVFVGNG